METLLAFNDNVALVGDWDGHVRTVLRPAEFSPDEWELHVRDLYPEPEHWYPDEPGVPFTKLTGNYWYESQNEMRLEALEGVEPYQSYTDNTDLSVRAAFLAHINQWVVADRQPDFALDGTA